MRNRVSSITIDLFYIDGMALIVIIKEKRKRERKKEIKKEIKKEKEKEKKKGRQKKEHRQ